MTYPVKIEFKQHPSGSWQDWSAYLVRPPAVKAKVESENEGEAGIIVFDSAAVSFRYESGNPVYAAFNIDLTDVQRYVFKISFPKSDKSYVQRYEGMADFSSIKWNEHNNVISFNIADKLTALGILSAVPSRTAVSVKDRVLAQFPSNEVINFIFQGNANEFWIATAASSELGVPYNSFSSKVVNAGEVIKVPEKTDPIGAEYNYNFHVITESTLASHPSWPALTFNKVKILPSHLNVSNYTYRYEGAAMDDIECLDKNLYGVDINNISGGVLQNLKGVETLFALYKQAWPDAVLLKKPSSFTFNIPSGYALRFTDEEPLGGTPLDAVKTLANSMKLYVYVDRSGNFVVHSKDDIDTAGTARTLGSTKVITRRRNYFWNKLVDGVTVVVKSWIQNETGEFIEGTASKTKQVPGSTAFIKPKNEISKELLTSDPNDITVELLNARAETEANNILNFYGLRHAAYDLVLDLDDNTIYWELVDLLTLLAEDFFFTSLTFEPVERTVALEPVETEGHDFDLRQIVVALSEENATSGSIQTTNYNTGGTGINYLFQNPLLLTGSQVSLQKTANLKVTSSQLDTVQDIQTTSTPTFNQLNISTPGTIGQAVRADRAILTAAPLSGGGNLTADRTIALSYNATNLKLTTNALNTIQDIATTSSPTFADLTLTGKAVIAGLIANKYEYRSVFTLYSGGTPRWLKIKTNLPFTDIMPQIKFTGFAYGNAWNTGATNIDFSITFYPYAGSFINYTAASKPNTWFPPTIKIAKDSNSKIVIVIDNENNYLPMIFVAVEELYGTNYGHYAGWTSAEEDITTETEVKTVPYSNSILTGNTGIGTYLPQAKLDVRGDVHLWGDLTFKDEGSYAISTLDGNLTIGTVDGFLKLEPTGNNENILIGDAWLKREGFVSQLTAWGISPIGEADFRYLYCDELHAKAFIADLEQALAGAQIICKSVALLYSDFTLPSAGGLNTLIVNSFAGFETAAVFQDNDLVRLRQFSREGGSLIIANAWGTVELDTTYGVNGFDTATKTQAYTFTRHLTVPGNASGTINEGTLVLDYGVSGNGFIEANAIDGLWAQNSPYHQIVTWNTTPGNYTIHSRIGNLRGITSVSGEYGMILGSGILDTDKYIRASNQAFQIHNVPFEIYSSSSLRANIDLSGNMKLGTNVSSAATTSFDFTSSSGALRLGNLTASKANMYFDGTNLAMRINTSERIVLDPVNDRLTIGDVSGMNTYITSSAIQLRVATTAKIQLNNDGSGFLASSIVNWNTSGVFNIGSFTVESDKIKFGTATAGFALNTTATPFVTGASSKGFEIYNIGTASTKMFLGARDSSSNLNKGFDWNITTADTLTLKGEILASKFSTKSSYGSGMGAGVDIESETVTLYRSTTRNYRTVIQADGYKMDLSTGYGWETNKIDLGGSVAGSWLLLDNNVYLESHATNGNNLTTASSSLHIKPYTDLHLTPQTGNLYLTPIGDVILDPTDNFVLPANDYDITLGMVNKKYLALHAAELWVQNLVAQNVMATIGGRILVGQTNQLTANLLAVATQMYVKYQFFGTLPIVCYLEAFEGTAKVEFIRIESYVGTYGGSYLYNITRNLDGSGANQWYAGDAVFNTGAPGAGFIDIYSIQSVRGASQAGPTVVGNIRNSTTYNDWNEAWAIGNLGGLYGQSSGTFGVGLGKYTNGSSFLLADSTNGIQIKARSGGVDTAVAQWAMNGDLTIGQTASVHTSITSTALQLKSGSAIRLSLSNDGSGYLANGNIAWTTAGVLSVAGWTIESAKIYIGSGSTNGGFYINTANSGSGYIYSWAQLLKGYAMTWHQNNNAGHLIMGQIAASSNTLKTGYFGIQMMDHLGKEYFALSAETTGETQAVYNRIANCKFDHEAISNVQYDPGAKGWKIHSDGTAEFNEITVRGTIYASLGQIGGWTIDSNRLYNSTSIELNASSKLVGVNSNKVKLFYTDTNNWGILGKNSSDQTIFQLGSSNTIAGWTLTTTNIYKAATTSGVFMVSSGGPDIGGPTGAGAGFMLYKDVGIDSIWAGIIKDDATAALTNVAFFAGYDASTDDELTDSPFYVTLGGTLKATNGSITGTFTVSGTLNVGSGLSLDGSGTGIITGGTIRTAASGERIELGIISTLPTISLYSSSGNQAFIRSYDDGESQKGLWVGSDITDNVDRSMFTCAKNSSTLQKNYSIGINNYYRFSFGLTTYADTTVPLLSLYKRDGISGYTLFDVYDNGNAMVLGKIIQDDVVRPYITVTNNSSSNVTIAIKVRKFNDTDTANNRHAIHWWISATQYGSPNKDIDSESGGAIATTYTKGNALDPETIDTKILNTSVSDSDETVELNFNGGVTDESLTFYLMVEAQGIIYASSQITVYYTKP